MVDLVGGLADLESRTLRFIGDAETRIREDYLRILRFFRFFAWYGYGPARRRGAESLRPAEGWAGAAVGRTGLGGVEEAAFGARSVARAALDAAGRRADQGAAGKREVGIDAIHGLVAAERDLGWAADALLRLEAIVPPDAEGCRRWPSGSSCRMRRRNG